MRPSAPPWPRPNTLFPPEPFAGDFFPQTLLLRTMLRCVTPLSYVRPASLLSGSLYLPHETFSILKKKEYPTVSRTSFGLALSPSLPPYTCLPPLRPPSFPSGKDRGSLSWAGSAPDRFVTHQRGAHFSFHPDGSPLAI